MKLLILSDTQIGAQRLSLGDERLADQERILGRIADLAEERDVDAIVHCGDAWERRNPSEEERLVWKRWVQRVTMQHRLVVVAGNHDLRNADLPCAHDERDEYDFVRRPEVVDLGGCSLACLPWTPLSHLKTEVGDEASGVAAQLLLDIASELRLRCPAGKPAVLALHWWVEGAGGIDTALIREPWLPIVDVEALGFGHVLAGHVHEFAYLGKNVASVGSPWVCSFGEAGFAHGALIHDTESGVTEFVSLPDRAFLTVDVDLAELADDFEKPFAMTETDFVTDAIDRVLMRVGSVVRVRVRATEDQWRRVDLPAIRQFVADAGAHKLVAVIPDIVRAERARVEGVDEGLAPASAVALWIEAQGLGVAERDGVLALLDSYLAAA